MSTPPEAVLEERVLVVPTELFHELGHFEGFSPDVDRYLRPLLDSGRVAYRPRAAMEEDPSYKQLIPYVLFRHTDDAGRVRVFSYRRGGGAGEARLRAKRSIGVGGHISTVDQDATAGGGDVYDAGLRRELAEEVRVDAACTERRVGLINDDQTRVGRVHLGVVHVFDLAEPRVEPLEDDLADARFLTAGEILDGLDAYESWSQIAARALLDGGG